VLICIQGDGIVRTASEVTEIAIWIEVQSLQKALIAEVHAELHGVSSCDLGEIVAELVSVPSLRKFPFVVVADGEATRNADERHAFAHGAQPWGDAKFR